MNLQTPIGPGLPIALARQFAFDQIDTKVSVDPKLAVAFWDEVSGSAPPVQPDITVFYCFLQFEGATFTLLEFVSGQTLEQLCVEEDAATCKKVIPLFSRLLDGHDGVAVAHFTNWRSAANLPATQAIQLSGFGIARAAAAVTAKLHGTMLVRPDGSWSEEILSKENGRSAVYPLLVAVYQELIGRLPKGAPLAPAALAQFSNRSLTKQAGPPVSRRIQAYMTAAGACALMLLGLFSLGHFLAQRAGSQRIAGLNLPQLPATPAVQATPSVQVTPPPEPEPPVVTPGKETLVISQAGLSRGPRLIRQIGPVYPEQAKKQKISGVVKLEVTVAEDGSVWKASVLSGDPLLAQGAAEAVKKWLYQPALINGNRSSSTTEVEIKFDLDATL